MLATRRYRLYRDDTWIFSLLAPLVEIRGQVTGYMENGTVLGGLHGKWYGPGRSRSSKILPVI